MNREIGDLDIRVEVIGLDIVVTSPGSDYAVIYHRRNTGRELVARRAPIGPLEFRVRAWTLANDKAHELGWMA